MSQILRRINLVLLAIVILQGIGFLWAQKVAAQAPAPFIYRPYYGNFPGWWATFDHKYENDQNPDDDTFVRFTGDEQLPDCAIAKSRRNQEFFVDRIEVKSRPKTGKEANRIEIDTVNEGETSVHESLDGWMAKVIGDLFTHPVPKPFNGVQVWAIARQGRG